MDERRKAILTTIYKGQLVRSNRHFFPMQQIAVDAEDIQARTSDIGPTDHVER